MTQAAFLEVDKAEAEELRRLLGEKALETRVMVEERYFGDTTLPQFGCRGAQPLGCDAQAANID